jgi:hypothetical protein
MALQANLLVLLNPLFVSRSQHGSGKPLPRPCALNVRCRGRIAGRATLGSVPAWVGEVRSVPPPSTRMVAARAAPQVGEGGVAAAAWMAAQRRIGRCATPPSNLELAALLTTSVHMLTCAPLPSQVARSCRLRLRLDGRWWQRRTRGRSRHHRRSAASWWLPR